MNCLKNQICVLGCMLRSHARNGNEFQTPGHRWLPAKHWHAWFLNSSKSKTHLKFMEHGMLSLSGSNMPWYKFCPIWGRFGYMLLTKWSFSQQGWWFSVGNVPSLWTKWYPLPLIAFKFFSRVNIEQQECCVNFCDFSGFVWTFLCIKWVFNAFMCIIKISTTCACSNAYKLVKKSNMCPWMQAKVPCKKWEWISNTRAPLIAGKTLRCLVFKF